VPAVLPGVVTGLILLLDAACNIVPVVTGAPLSTSATPWGYVAATVKSLLIAMLTPGTLNCFNRGSTTARPARFRSADENR